MATWKKRAGLALLAGAVAGAGLGAAPKLKSSWRNFDAPPRRCRRSS